MAVDVIARKIKISRQFRSVTDYLPHFEQNENQVLKRPKRGNGDLWYSKSFDELWKKGFQDLSNDAAEMLGILCFMSPESIPLFLFTDNGWTQILPGWTFLEDTERIVHLRLPNHWTCQANFQSIIRFEKATDRLTRSPESMPPPATSQSTASSKKAGSLPG